MSFPYGPFVSGHCKRAEATHAPAAATKATVTLAAPGAGKRYIIDQLSATIACGATAQTPIAVNLISSATTKKSWLVAAPANGQGGVALPECHFAMGYNEAVTLEFEAAGVASSKQAVNIDAFISE